MLIRVNGLKGTDENNLRALKIMVNKKQSIGSRLNSIEDDK